MEDAIQNFIRIQSRNPLRARYVFMDTKDCVFQRVFAKHRVKAHVKHIAPQENGRYAMVLCTVGRNDADRFPDIMRDLSNCILLCGHMDYAEACGAFVEHMMELAGIDSLQKETVFEKNYIHFIPRDSRHEVYAYFDTSDSLAFEYFGRHRVLLKTEGAYSLGDMPYIMVLCRVKKKYEEGFLAALEEFSENAPPCQYGTYSECCQVFLDVAADAMKTIKEEGSEGVKRLNDAGGMDKMIQDGLAALNRGGAENG